MRSKTLTYLFAFVLFCSANVFAGGAFEHLAADAISPDSTISAAAIEQLRTAGPAGLAALRKTYAAEIAEFGSTGRATPRWNSIAAALDAVAMQKDDYAGGLYWYTDLEKARVVAKRSGKPILTLRLLGNLNEEFSCANSRLFRSLLYSNAEIAKFLNENYILHWRSVRPAPKVTIDFGDGRKIERTVTGNSIHYVLDPDGVVVEALPGLYSPQKFLAYLIEAKAIIDNSAKLDPRRRNIAYMRYRRDNFEKIKNTRDKLLAEKQIKLEETSDSTAALPVMPRAMSKAVVVNEVAILRFFDNFAKYEPQINVSQWEQMAEVFAADASIDNVSKAFIRRQNIGTGISEPELQRLFQRINDFAALDTTRNELMFHPQLYADLNAGTISDIEDFNAMVYDKLFKTPHSDKWLGLYSTDLYTALDGNGLTGGN